MCGANRFFVVCVVTRRLCCSCEKGKRGTGRAGGGEKMEPVFVELDPCVGRTVLFVLVMVERGVDVRAAARVRCFCVSVCFCTKAALHPRNWVAALV